jgi:predicted outer membrane repeat protein
MFFSLKMNRFVLCCGLLIAVVFAVPFAQAADIPVFRVDVQRSARKMTGQSWSTAFCSLQSGIDAAFEAGGGEVWVRAGIYKPFVEDRDSTFTLRPGVRLYGGFRGTETLRNERNPKANRTMLSGDIGAAGLPADNCYHVVTAATDTQIDGFIISRGNANGLKQKGAGGGIVIPNGSRKVVLANCTLEKNMASWQGGGVYGERIEMTATNCTFFSNSASGGGGLASQGSSDISIQNCIFSANTSQSGGGALSMENEPRVTLSDTQFTSNKSTGNGGAMRMTVDAGASAKLELTACTFSSNQSRSSGGALFLKGAFEPIMHDCLFTGNSGVKGTGGLVVQDDTLALLLDCTFAKNRGKDGFSDASNDETSGIFYDEEAFLAAQEPEETPPEEATFRMLEDVYAYNTPDTKVQLRNLFSKQAYTVITLGDLSDPEFITNYRNIEALAVDFKPLNVNFCYLYRALLHPENNGYLQPYNLNERAKHVQTAKSLLSTKTDWLFDTMDNQALKALQHSSESTVFIYSAEGAELYSGRLENHNPLRKILEEIAGTAASKTSPQRFKTPRIKAKHITAPDLLDRVHFNPETEPFSPLVIEPQKPQASFPVKLRAEADDDLLATGNGRLYLGFHVDPLYAMQWDNSSDPLTYVIKSPAGLAAPSTDQAPEIKKKPYDNEPREFVLTARQLDLSKPLQLRVDFTIYSPLQEKSIAVTQYYAIQLERDPYGGTAFRRQIAENEAPRKNKVAMPSALRDLDANNDGLISRTELNGKLWSKFSDIDENKDGYLSASEYRAYLRDR